MRGQHAPGLGVGVGLGLGLGLGLGVGVGLGLGLGLARTVGLLASTNSDAISPVRCKAEGAAWLGSGLGTLTTARPAGASGGRRVENSSHRPSSSAMRTW